LKTVKSKPLMLLHLVLGLFFTISGILTMGNKHYIFNIWLISLGFSFLINPLKVVLFTKINPRLFKIFSYVIYAVVIISGVIFFTMEFNVG